MSLFPLSEDYIDLSVVVPLFNEEHSITPLYNAIIGAIEPLGRSFELLFIDDGSDDGTFGVAKALALKDRRLRVVSFRRNYGQTPAMAAGIEHARGRCIVTMDGDLQNDPVDILKFLDKLAEGHDIVVGWRHQRQDSLLTRKIPSRIANWLIGNVTGVHIKDNGCSLKAFRADIVKNIPLYSEMHRFIPAMASLAGPSIAEIKVQHHARRFGQSKYGLSRIYKVLLDLVAIKALIVFLAKPLVGFAWGAGISALVSLMAFAGCLVHWLSAPNDPTIVLFGLGLLYACLSVVLMVWGILAELIYRTGDVKLEDFARLKTGRKKAVSHSTQ